MKIADIDKKYSLEEYIKLDEEGTERHEFYYGKLFAMPGETLEHNEICGKLYALLLILLKGKGWKTYIESVKAEIEKQARYVYPDIIVTAAKNEKLKGNERYVIDSPILIAEVLSDSTRKYDSTDKFIQYQKISSLKYYLLVEPEKPMVIFYEKDKNGEWSSTPFRELDEVISLQLFDIKFSLAEIYS